MSDGAFIDTVRITVKSGDGGDGICSFQAYKGKPACGPDGGDGGKGGDVYIKADGDLGDLAGFRYRTKYRAGNGVRGGPSGCTGRSGEDAVICVPVGTVVRDADTGAVIADMFADGERAMICEGGRGGRGNAHFCTPKRHAPHFAQKGEKTEEHVLMLELKTIADVGIIGFPNVGKSTILSVISRARPKIADYRFTTLSPNLGVVTRHGESFVAADIPGLIEGASDGAGLGHDFLRHIERTRMLLHVMDVSDPESGDTREDFRKINRELVRYSEKLASLPQIVVLNKCDACPDRKRITSFKRSYGRKYKIYAVSAATGEGMDDMISGIFDMLGTLPKARRMETDADFTYRKKTGTEFEIYRDGDGAFVVTGPLADMIERNVNFSDPDSLAYFQTLIKTSGVSDALAAMGVKEHDTVVVGDTEFEYIP